MSYKFLLKSGLNVLFKFLLDINNYFNIEKQYHRRNAVLKGDYYKNFYYYLE